MASRYERSLRNPLRRPLVGVPTHTPIRTKKISYRATAVVDVATDATETKILWMPHAGCAEDVDVFRVVGGSISSGTNRTNSRFTASQFGDGLMARLVSARLTVCGCSAEDNGVIVAGTSVNEDISGYDAADLMSRISEKHLVIARTVEDEVHINYVPGSDDERVAFLDDVARGPYEGLRDITSEAYPARHVATWKGTSVDSEIVSVPYTYTYATKDVVYGDVDLPYTYSYDDPILYYPWGVQQISSGLWLQYNSLSNPYQGVITGPPNSTEYTAVSFSGYIDINNGSNDHRYDVMYKFRNNSTQKDVLFGLRDLTFAFHYGRYNNDSERWNYDWLPKRVRVDVYLLDGLSKVFEKHISAAEARDCWNNKTLLQFNFPDIQFIPCIQFNVEVMEWWNTTTANGPVWPEAYMGSYFNMTRDDTEDFNKAYLTPLNVFADGNSVVEVENIVFGVGTVTNNQVTQVNESTVSETVNVPYEIIHGRQQLLVEVHTNWEFIGTVLDGSETLTPSTVVTIGDGVLSDVFTTPRNAIEKRKRFDDTAEGFVGTRERASRRKKLEMIEEDAYESP